MLNSNLEEHNDDSSSSLSLSSQSSSSSSSTTSLSSLSDFPLFPFSSTSSPRRTRENPESPETRKRNTELSLQSLHDAVIRELTKPRTQSLSSSQGTQNLRMADIVENDRSLSDDVQPTTTIKTTNRIYPFHYRQNSVDPVQLTSAGYAAIYDEHGNERKSFPLRRSSSEQLLDIAAALSQSQNSLSSTDNVKPSTSNKRPLSNDDDDDQDSSQERAQRISVIVENKPVLVKQVRSSPTSPNHTSVLKMNPNNSIISAPTSMLSMNDNDEKIKTIIQVRGPSCSICYDYFATEPETNQENQTTMATEAVPATTTSSVFSINHNNGGKLRGEPRPNLKLHSTTCGHIYCSTCIESILKCSPRPSCAVCRTKLGHRSHHRLFIQ